VRFWHWATMTAFAVLAVTGYLIGSPWPSTAGEAFASFSFGYVRMAHEISGYLLAVLFLVRVYWAFAGNHHARAIFLPPIFNGKWWRGLFRQMGYYLFLREESDLWVGHNPLAQIAMTVMFTLGTLVLILTGFALYAEQWPWGVGYMRLFGWVIVLLGDAYTVRMVHHFAMWYVVLFACIHVYMVFREDVMSGASVVSTMISGVRLFKTTQLEAEEAEVPAAPPRVDRRAA